MNRTLLFILLCLQLQASGRQPKEFYFQHIKTEHGLSNGIITDILKDKQGFLWAATANGLNCFDGSHFVTWKANPADQKQLIHDDLYSLCEDTSGNIWCTHSAGISRYNRLSNTFTNYTLVNSVTGKPSIGTTNGIVCTRRGVIAALADIGVYLYDNQEDRFVHYPEVKAMGSLDCDGLVNQSFLEDPSSNGLWLGTSHGLKYFDLDAKVYFSYKNNPKKSSLFNDHLIGPLAIDSKGNLVFADLEDRAIKWYSFGAQTTDQISTAGWLGSRKIRFDCILPDEEGNLWMSINNEEAHFFERKTGALFPIKHDNDISHSIAGDYFRNGLLDTAGNVFLGTVNGISYLNLREHFVSVYRLPDSLSHNRKYYLHQLLNCDRQNNIWMAPAYRQLLKFNPEDQSFRAYDILNGVKGLNRDDINISCMEAGADRLYFATTHGLYEYTVATGEFNKNTVIPASEGLDGRYMLAMLLSKNGELWFTSHHNGVFRYETKTGAYSHYRFDSAQAGSFSQQYVYDIEEDGNGDIWFCVEYDGLLKFNREKDSFEYLTRGKGSESEMYYAFTCDRNNTLWVLGLLSGLNVFNRDRVALEPVHVGSLSNFRYNHLLADEEGKIWLAYYSQYSVFDPGTDAVRNFTIELARTNNEYANFSCRMPDGRIVTESWNSFVILDPDFSEKREPLEPVTISGFSAGRMTSQFLADTQLQLQSSQNFFSFNFSTLSLLLNKDIRFAYKLEGMHDEWIDCDKQQTAYFTNVPGGSYVFRVRAVTTNGAMQEAAFPVHIELASVFYATWWFRSILILALLACVAIYIRILKKRYLRRESDKAIAYFANSLQGRNRVEELLWDITHNVITRTNLVDCVVYLLDEKRNVLVQQAAYGEKNPGENTIFNPMEIPVGKGIVGSVAASGLPEIVADTSKDARYIADDANRLSEMAVPIVAEGKVIGVIDSEHPQRRFFTKEHLQLLKTIASIAATKILKAQKEEEVEESDKRLQELKMQVLHTRQEALRAQMNPHFIFNCLNSINGFILQNDAATASTFLIKFSRLIRLILEHSHERSVSLQSELDALKLYIEMEALRFEKRFTYSIEVDPSLEMDNVQVPPLILQPFVENSIWHGLLHKDAEGLLKIQIGQSNGSLVCSIEDNGVGRERSASFRSKTTTHKKSLGVKLTGERLALLNMQGNKKSSVEVVDMKDHNGQAQGTRVVVSLPLMNEFNQL